MFSSLNFGNPGDLAGAQRDPMVNIRANIQRVLDALGCGGREVVEVHQVHGAACHAARIGGPSHADDPGGHDTQADAVVTDDPARMVAVRVADCCPVLMTCGNGRIVH